MDSITTETLKGRHVRKLSSVSSEASETLDTDIGTPSKRTTRRSFITAALGTPTRASTRATRYDCCSVLFVQCICFYLAE